MEDGPGWGKKHRLGLGPTQVDTDGGGLVFSGFFHGTGHGLGLDIHEPPSISQRPSILRAGHVVTVEPGLYYLGLGGVRIEDVALVTADGSRNLTRVPKVLEV